MSSFFLRQALRSGFNFELLGLKSISWKTTTRRDNHALRRIKQALAADVWMYSSELDLEQRLSQRSRQQGHAKHCSKYFSFLFQLTPPIYLKVLPFP